MKILFLGEIVGKSGLYLIKKMLASLKDEFKTDYVIASGNATTGGFGIGKNHALYLKKLGINLLTGGDMIFLKKDLAEDFNNINFVLRPANLSNKASGKGLIFPTINGSKTTIINLMGQSGFTRQHASNPFTLTTDLLGEKLKDNPVKIVIFNAMASAEKKALGYHLAGLASCVIGYGTRSMTADAKILDGTALISDLGRVGSRHSVGGLKAPIEIEKWLTARPLKSSDAWEGLEINALCVEFDDTTGKAINIEVIRRSVETPTKGETDSEVE